jgi:hypothetical protein
MSRKVSQGRRWKVSRRKRKRRIFPWREEK